MANNAPQNNMLRKLKLFGIIALLAVAVVAFSSCTKEKKIVGKWKVTKAKLDGDTLSDMKGAIWTFKENGNCTCEFVIGEVDGEWSISKDDLTIELEQGSMTMTCDFTIDELTNSEMELSGKAKETGYSDGERYTYSYKLDFEFEKK